MALPTLATLVEKSRNADRLLGIVEEVITTFPELAFIPARTVDKDTYTYVKRTAAPGTVGFRSANDGLEPSGSTYSEVTVNLKFLNAIFMVDVAVASAYIDGADAYLEAEAKGAMSGFLTKLLTQFYYGTTAPGSSSGFSGLKNLVDSSMVVNAGGTTANTGSSVWALNMRNTDTLCLTFKEDDMTPPLTMTDPIEVLVAGSTSGTYFSALKSELRAWVGVQPGHKYSMGRIKNLTEDSGKGLTDNLLVDLWNKFPAGMKPNLIVMSRRSYGQLIKSRTSYNPVGIPPGLVEEWHGIPIVTSDVIVDNEALA